KDEPFRPRQILSLVNDDVVVSRGGPLSKEGETTQAKHRQELALSEGLLERAKHGDDVWVVLVFGKVTHALINSLHLRPPPASGWVPLQLALQLARGE